MSPKATTRTKKWGQADRDLLADLTNRQLIDITDTSHQNIEQVRETLFGTATKRISAIISAIIRQCETSKSSIAVRDATEVRCGV